MQTYTFREAEKWSYCITYSIFSLFCFNNKWSIYKFIISSCKILIHFLKLHFPPISIHFKPNGFPITISFGDYWLWGVKGLFNLLFRFCFLKLFLKIISKNCFSREEIKKSCLIKLFQQSHRLWGDELSQQEIGTVTARDRITARDRNHCSRRSEHRFVAPEIGATRGHACEIRTTTSAICGCDSARQWLWLEVLEIEDGGGVSWDVKWWVGGW